MNFEQIVEQYSKLVYKIALDMTASEDTAADLVQDSYLSLYTHFNRYRRLNESEMRNVLCKIMLNKCRDWLRKQRPTEVLEECSRATPDFVEELLKQEERQWIYQAIGQLGAPYSTVLTGFYLEEKSMDVLAKELGTTNGTVRVQLTRARKQLREILKKEGGYESGRTN